MMKKIIQMGGLSLILLSLLLINNLHAEEHAKPKVRTPPTNLSGEEARTVKLYQKVLPTVVTIFSTKQVVSLKGRIKVESLGSGVLIPPTPISSPPPTWWMEPMRSW